MSADEAVVVTNQLTKRYGEVTALDRLTLSVPRGKILGFIGPNGAGKTTMIKILVGQARPTSGSAAIAGLDCAADSKKIKRLVGYMPDTFGSYDNMRVHEYLDFFGAAFRIPPRVRRQRIDEVMEICGASYMRDRFVESLSHGMKQRVAIARTLLHDPQVLILDEPANGLDPQARIEMRQILLQLAAGGKTLIVTSHILPELSRICDLVAIITHGRLRAFGELNAVMRQVQQRRTIEIQLASADQIPRAIEIARPFIEPDAEMIGSTTEAAVRFQTSTPENDLGELLAELVRQGLPVNQFRELQTDLEDTFLSITRSTEHEAEQAASATESAGHNG